MQAALSTVIQLAVPDDKMGRVNSAIGTTGSLAMLISMAVAGAVGDMVNLRLIYVISGTIIALGGGVSFFLIPEAEPDKKKEVGSVITVPVPVED